MHNNISQEAYFLAREVRQRPQQSRALVCPALREALTIRQDLEFFLGGAVQDFLFFFPPYDQPPFGAIEPSPEIAAERMATLWRLLQDKPYLLIVPESELAASVIAPDALQKSLRTLQVGQEIGRADLARWLTGQGYKQEALVEAPGDFALRGAIVDIFTPQERYPLRFELDGDQLVGVRSFDPATQVMHSSAEEPGSPASGTFCLIPASDRPASIPSATLKDYLQKAHFLAPPPPPLSMWSSERLRREYSLSQLQSWREQKLNIRLVCHTDIQAGRLQDLLRDQGIKGFKIEVGKLSSGFGLPDEGILILTEEEIFGHKTFRRPSPRRGAAPAVTFGELHVGDTMVHEEHGLCRYQGLKHLKIGKTVGDYLHLEFLGGDKLFLPVTRLEVVQKYVGGESRPPLDSLRGTRWNKVKTKARREVFKIAAELLKIHARRQIQPGFAFPPPDSMDEEFASHFPFDETPDQAQAIEDVLRDLQNPTPMDRLICGDVGYGKTEVAMRAAFKVVSAGRQALFLVPTTILALQHYETFMERFDKLAVSTAMLSRFASRKEQKEILETFARGELDIVIGTHRLLQEDVRPKNLGLLIVDEEQRFGVRHKERIKKLKPTVDVLTLSATPIPRTLHMSLIGLRDLSLIHTPPVDRIAIRTFVAEWEEALVKHAVTQELNRGGQVFFVHNRVATLPAMLARLTGLFPSARIGVAHGQMKAHALERVMLSFLHQKIDILLTTAIVESGIDVPSANTMLVNRADAFGLAQLYQLRGRVGRSDRQAYCYLLIPKDAEVTHEARRRLEVLARHADLGSGFQIASHDLEIRGAGNLLGTSQAGFVEAIGYELYTKLLARAIRKLRGQELEEEIEPEVHIAIPAYIPETYVADVNLRMGLYKRMSHLRRAEEVEKMRAEIRDRFGPLPAPLENLLEIVTLKHQAARKGLRSLKAASLEEARKMLRSPAGWTKDRGQ